MATVGGIKGSRLKRLICMFGIIVAIAVVAVPPKDLKATDTFLTYDQLKEYEAKKAEAQWSADLVAHSKRLIAQRKKNTCVLALRYYFGVPRSEVQGQAKSTRINSQTGKVGAVIVFRNLSKWGHVGFQITPKRTDGNFEFFHCNTDFKGTCKIETINKNDRRISGYRIINY